MKRSLTGGMRSICIQVQEGLTGFRDCGRCYGRSMNDTFPSKEALEAASKQADIAVVSSANTEAIFTEWEYYGLLDHVDVVCAQDVGSKEYCIGQLIRKGYEPTQILFCGDALGDLAAAEKNHTLFYPICWGGEQKNWEEFEEGFQRVLAGTYQGAYFEEKLKQFKKNLS